MRGRVSEPREESGGGNFREILERNKRKEMKGMAAWRNTNGSACGGKRQRVNAEEEGREGGGREAGEEAGETEGEMDGGRGKEGEKVDGGVETGVSARSCPLYAKVTESLPECSGGYTSQSKLYFSLFASTSPAGWLWPLFVCYV